jgi:hypothetical protein
LLSLSVPLPVSVVALQQIVDLSNSSAVPSQSGTLATTSTKPALTDSSSTSVESENQSHSASTQATNVGTQSNINSTQASTATLQQHQHPQPLPQVVVQQSHTVNQPIISTNPVSQAPTVMNSQLINTPTNTTQTGISTSVFQPQMVPNQGIQIGTASIASTNSGQGIQMQQPLIASQANLMQQHQAQMMHHHHSQQSIHTQQSQAPYGQIIQPGSMQQSTTTTNQAQTQMSEYSVMAQTAEYSSTGTPSANSSSAITTIPQQQQPSIDMMQQSTQQPSMNVIYSNQGYTSGHLMQPPAYQIQRAGLSTSTSGYMPGQPGVTTIAPASSNVSTLNQPRFATPVAGSPVVHLQHPSQQNAPAGSMIVINRAANSATTNTSIQAAQPNQPGQMYTGYMSQPVSGMQAGATQTSISHMPIQQGTILSPSQQIQVAPNAAVMQQQSQAAASQILNQGSNMTSAQSPIINRMQSQLQQNNQSMQPQLQMRLNQSQIQNTVQQAQPQIQQVAGQQQTQVQSGTAQQMPTNMAYYSPQMQMTAQTMPINAPVGGQQAMQMFPIQGQQFGRDMMMPPQHHMTNTGQPIQYATPNQTLIVNPQGNMQMAQGTHSQMQTYMMPQMQGGMMQPAANAAMQGTLVGHPTGQMMYTHAQFNSQQQSQQQQPQVIMMQQNQVAYQQATAATGSASNMPQSFQISSQPQQNSPQLASQPKSDIKP